MWASYGEVSTSFKKDLSQLLNMQLPSSITWRRYCICAPWDDLLYCFLYCFLSCSPTWPGHTKGGCILKADKDFLQGFPDSCRKPGETNCDNGIIHLPWVCTYICEEPAKYLDRMCARHTRNGGNWFGQWNYKRGTFLIKMALVKVM